MCNKYNCEIYSEFPGCQTKKEKSIFSLTDRRKKYQVFKRDKHFLVIDSKINLFYGILERYHNAQCL